MQIRENKSARKSLCLTALAAVVMAALYGTPAQAVEFNTGNPDIQLRWDNTLRYNLAQRVEETDTKIGNSALFDEGTYSFEKGDWVANRVDILSELDFIWKDSYGFRVSAAGWYDSAYGKYSGKNPRPPLSNIPSYIGGEYSDYIERLYNGPSGEILDAFAFANFDLGKVPVKLRAGRHTVFWGESLLLGGHLHSVSYGQMPLDLQKGFATPGTEVKELFRPLNQVSAQAQLTDTVSLAGQYFFQWEDYRYPEGGTYLGPVDFAFRGPDRQFLSAALGFAANGAVGEPDQSGEYGLSLRWSPELLDGTLGFYYRNYADKIPQVFLTRVAPGNSEYNMIFADDVELYGVSFAKNIFDLSVGAEFSYRHNTPLSSQVLGIAPGGLPEEGETPGARGNTFHGLVNVLGIINDTPVFDAATWAAELTWSSWDKVTSGARLFNALGFAPCVGRDKWDGCVTDNFFGIALSFTPTWYQVFPGMDMSAPLTFAQGISGNAATVFAGNEDLGNYSIGVAADFFQRYRVDFKYIDYLGKYKDNGVAVTTFNGFTTALKDRGFVSLTLKTTF